MESGELIRGVNSGSVRPTAGLSQKRGSIGAGAGDGGTGAAAFADAVWRKSSWSSYNGNCVAVARLGGLVGVRDTKDDGAGEILVFDGVAWRSFINSVKSGSHIH